MAHRDLSWLDLAACLGMDTELFFARDREGRGRSNGHYKAGKAICATCPVRARCLEFGLGEEHGVWGGTTERERRNLRRQRRAA